MGQLPMKTNNLIACAECDALQRGVPLEDHGRALCARCAWQRRQKQRQ